MGHKTIGRLALGGPSLPLGRGTLAFTVYQSRLKIFLPNPPEKNEMELEGTPVVEAKDSRDTIIRLTVFLRSLAFASRRRVNSTSQHFQNFGIVFELQGPDVGLRVCRSAWQIGPFSRAPPSHTSRVGCAAGAVRLRWV